ncbi:uncharacterized protein K452DRAFT_318004 [Aplosporella prunicola CBS 121167]|uniref:Mediator of RNA polymerase II transcription subunit 18 n=1 Tax=Aplosporella prunicola CBS 121167 TaxID=1176127 RepID=A0A6A6BDS5_9PEZI|nr:uncharacterized protein K452DRAFT_318004 [Aplosporella prunicola CBS 121167]KAF2142342.1 hypothetical protein K452DRAFT_318004 [Aplosporella prunicola CBS 121167]
MHELLLFGQVPPSRHEQLLNILAGIAGMQPQRSIQRHVVYKPQRAPMRRQYAQGASQNLPTNQRQQAQNPLTKDQYYWQIVRDVHEADFENGPDAPRNGDQKGWATLFQDVPEPGKRPANLRWTQTTDISSGNAHAFMKASLYRYVSEYVDEGYQLVHKNAVILLHRILRFPNPDPSIDHPLEKLPPFNNLEPLDKSGGYVLQVTVTLQDGYKPETLEKGNAEIMAFKNLMKGVVELDAADRLAMDTRVKPMTEEEEIAAERAAREQAQAQSQAVPP